MHTWFWLSFFVVVFVVFPDVYWSDNVFCTWGGIVARSCLKCLFFLVFFLKLSLFMCCSFFFAWVVVEGFRCVDGLFRVYTSPLMSFRKHNWERRFSLVDKCSRTILQKCSPAHCFDFSGWAKKKEKKELNKQKIPNRKSTFLHFLLVLNLLFLFYFTEDGRFTNALYIKYLYVFVKQTYDASGFL